MPSGVYIRTEESKKRMSEARVNYFKTHSAYNKGLRFFGEKNNNWKGEDVTYSAIHNWLKRNFGNPIECELCGKVGFKQGRKWNIQWALLKGREYQHKRENFLGLCVKCHVRYDENPFIGWNKGKKMSLGQKEKISKANQGKPAWNKGKKLSTSYVR